MEECKKIQEYLPFYFEDGILLDEESRQVEDHICHCDACRQELKELQENASLLHQMGRSIFQAPPAFAGNVMAALHAGSTGLDDAEPGAKPAGKVLPFRKRRLLVSGIAAAAVLAVTVVGTTQLLPDSAQPPVQIAQETAEPNDPTPSVPETTPDAPPDAPPDEAIPEATAGILSVPNGPETEPTADNAAAPVTAPEETPDAATPNTNVQPEAEPEPIAQPEAPEVPGTVEEPAPVSDPVVVPSSNVVLMNQNSQIRSTLLKMSYADVETGVQTIYAETARCGGTITDTTVSADSNCEIITAKIPQAQADNFLVSVTSSGFLLSQEQDYKTSLYGQLMEEYLQIQTQLNSSNSQEVLMQLKTQLAEVEQQMNSAQQEAQYESVVIWVQLAE